MKVKFRHKIAVSAFILALATSAAAAEKTAGSVPFKESPDLAGDLFLLPDNPAVQQVLLPFSSKAGTLTLGAYNVEKANDAPFENTGVSLTGSTGSDLFNFNGAVDLSRRGTSLSLSVKPKDKGATLGLLYLYDQADKTNTSNRTPLMILPRIGSSQLFPGKSGSEMELVGLYADYALGKDLGIHWAMGYAAVNNEKASLEGKAWEYNVGVAYTFFNNFMYEAHFGYMSADDSAAPAAAEPMAAPVEEVYMMTNNIRMQF